MSMYKKPESKGYEVYEEEKGIPTVGAPKGMPHTSNMEMEKHAFQKKTKNLGTKGSA